MNNLKNKPRNSIDKALALSMYLCHHFRYHRVLALGESGAGVIVRY
ncbi:MAG: hypothetical protein LKI18_03385 [Prevotella sp.]|jgi:hypothetical protein|nr:hypothetical protein [Prevotella sp.]